VLGVFGFIGIGNWFDEKIAAFIKRREMEKVNKQCQEALQAKVAELNETGE